MLLCLQNDKALNWSSRNPTLAFWCNASCTTPSRRPYQRLW